jgi:hypothetical protein
LNDLGAKASARVDATPLDEQEIAEIKRKLLEESEGKPPTLEGIWKDIEVTDEDLDAAKRSLFPKFDDI